MVGTLITVTAVVVRVFAGPVLDRFGRKGALVAGTLIMACTVFSYAVFPLVGVILGVRLLQGIGWGLSSMASSTMAADVIPKHRFAEGMGYFSITSFIALHGREQGIYLVSVYFILSGHCCSDET